MNDDFFADYSNTFLLERFDSIPRYGTFGRLYFDDVKVCDTLEPVKTDGLSTHAVRQGYYGLSVNYSPKFHEDLPLLEVLGRSGIRIHCGNYLKDTHGCILVGQCLSNHFLIRSRLALQKVMNLIRVHSITGIYISESLVIQKSLFSNE